jgi:1-acyl-sn-glycerol-3-phosphate acyltransferase
MVGSIAMMQRLERFWRQCGTGFAFALFGIGGLLLALLIFPFVTLVFRDKAQRTRVAQRIVHFTWFLFMRIVIALRILDFDTDGAADLRSASGTLVIANHPSLLDIVLIMSLMDRTQCVVKAGVWKNPFMRGAIKATNYIPNLGDPQQVIDDCVAALKSGNNLVIFPEGSRTVPGQKVRLQRGFANIAIRAHAPIRLVTVSCTPPMLRKGEKWYQCPVSRPRYHVRVCELVETDRFALAEIPSRAARSLTAHVTRRFEELAAYGAA